MVYVDLYRRYELEHAVCGSAGIDVQLLKRHTQYEGFTPDCETVRFFWSVVSAMAKEDQSKILRFVWARTRLPPNDAGFDRPFKITLMRRSQPDHWLPEAHTCFFQIDLPQYSCSEVLRTQLLTAARNCIGYDLDGRAQGVMETLEDSEDDL